MTVLSRYVGEQPTRDRDIPVASFSGNGGHRERDRCLRRQRDKYFSVRNRPNTGFLALIWCFLQEKYWFRDFPDLFPRPGIFFGFLSSMSRFFRSNRAHRDRDKGKQRTDRYRDRCSPTHRDSSPEPIDFRFWISTKLTHQCSNQSHQIFTSLSR
jgi:hypothetical protein